MTLQAGSTSPVSHDHSASRPPRAPAPSVLRSQLRSSRVAPLPAPISVTAPPSAAPVRASFSAPTSPVARRARSGGVPPPLGGAWPPHAATSTLPLCRRDGARAASGSGVCEAIAAQPPHAHDSAPVCDSLKSSAVEAAPRGPPEMQQPLWWLPASPPADSAGPPDMLDGRPRAGRQWALPPLAVVEPSMPSSPIAAGASPVWAAAAVGLDAAAFLPGAAAAEERDVSEEFDVALLIGDLNYRCALALPLLLKGGQEWAVPKLMQPLREHRCRILAMHVPAPGFNLQMLSVCMCCMAV